MMTIEECWILKTVYKGSSLWVSKYDRYTTGEPASVVFDYKYVYANEKNIIGWIHTHPHWPSFPSGTDHATMKAWNTALGRPLLCCIVGTDKTRAWWYFDDESDPVEGSIRRIGKYLYGNIPPKPQLLLEARAASALIEDGAETKS
jgi:proteasome lid subunit RPN8/RPN11